MKPLPLAAKRFPASPSHAVAAAAGGSSSQQQQQHHPVMQASEGRRSRRGGGCPGSGATPSLPPIEIGSPTAWDGDSEAAIATPNSVITTATSYMDGFGESVRRDRVPKTESSITVAVRVRPFSKREIEVYNRRRANVASHSSNPMTSSIRPYRKRRISSSGAGEEGRTDDHDDVGNSVDGNGEHELMPTVDVEDDNKTVYLIHPSNANKLRANFQFDFVFSSFCPSFEFVNGVSPSSKAGGSTGLDEIPMNGGQMDLEDTATLTDIGDGIRRGKRGKGNIIDDSIEETPEEAMCAEREQVEIFECIAMPLVDTVWDGYNACIFAYGQTSSGKTYTMMGDRKHRGVIPRLCHALFEKISKEHRRASDRDTAPVSQYNGLTSTSRAASTMMSVSQPMLPPIDDGLELRKPGGGGAGGGGSNSVLTDGNALGTPGSGSIGVGLSLPPLRKLNSTASAKTNTGVPFSQNGAEMPSTPHPANGISNGSNSNNNNNNNSSSISVTIAFMEIYNEQVRDLLAETNHRLSSRALKGRGGRSAAAAAAAPPNQPAFHIPRGGGRWQDENAASPNLRVRQHPRNGPFVEGLTTMTVKTWEECSKYISQANRARAQSATEMNERSSRSHVIVQLTVTQTETLGARVRGKDVCNHRVSKINLVDLAGSERTRSNANMPTGEYDTNIGATAQTSNKQRSTETNSINQSLLTLRRVIDALVAKKRTTRVVPYRESLLTWILSDNFGGNSKTIMCATVSPHESNYQETESTLRYATLARGIVNRMRVNEDPSAKLIRALRLQLKQLQEEVSKKNQAGWRVTELQNSIEENKWAVSELKRKEETMVQKIEEGKQRETKLLKSLRHRERREEKWKREAERLLKEKELLAVALTGMVRENPAITNGEDTEAWVKKMLNDNGPAEVMQEGRARAASEISRNSASTVESSDVRLRLDSGNMGSSMHSSEAESEPDNRTHDADDDGDPLTDNAGDPAYDDMLIPSPTSWGGKSRDQLQSVRSINAPNTCSNTALPNGSDLPRNRDPEKSARIAQSSRKNGTRPPQGSPNKRDIEVQQQPLQTLSQPTPIPTPTPATTPTASTPTPTPSPPQQYQHQPPSPPSPQREEEEQVPPAHPFMQTMLLRNVVELDEDEDVADDHYNANNNNNDNYDGDYDDDDDFETDVSVPPPAFKGASATKRPTQQGRGNPSSRYSVPRKTSIPSSAYSDNSSASPYAPQQHQQHQHQHQRGHGNRQPVGRGQRRTSNVGSASGPPSSRGNGSLNSSFRDLPSGQQQQNGPPSRKHSGFLRKGAGLKREPPHAPALRNDYRVDRSREDSMVSVNTPVSPEYRMQQLYVQAQQKTRSDRFLTPMKKEDSEQSTATSITGSFTKPRNPPRPVAPLSLGGLPNSAPAVMSGTSTKNLAMQTVRPIPLYPGTSSMETQTPSLPRDGTMKRAVNLATNTPKLPGIGTSTRKSPVTAGISNESSQPMSIGVNTMRRGNGASLNGSTKRAR